MTRTSTKACNMKIGRRLDPNRWLIEINAPNADKYYRMKWKIRVRRAEPAKRPRSTRALADSAWLSSRPTSDALHPTLLAKAPLHRHRTRPTAAGSKPCDQGFRAPCRTARARFAPWKTGRSPTEHTKRSADLAWLSSWPTSDALHLTPFAAALRHRHRARPAAVASEHRDPRF